MVDLGAFFGLATGQTAVGWMSLGINLIVSTLVGGVVLLVLVGIIGAALGEGIKPVNAFLVVLLINLINLFGIIGVVGAFLPSIVLMILPIVIWIALIKVFFGEMSPFHAVIVGLVGWLVSIMIIPGLVSMVMGLIPV